MSFIPIANDVANLVGDFAEQIENRSLLLDKFVLPKYWIDEGADRQDKAARWSLLRICDGGSKILLDEANDAQYMAQKRLDSRGGEQASVAAKILRLLANTNVESADSQSLRSQHSQRLHQLARSSFGENACVFNARLQSRMAINLSDGLIENAGIALDRLFGLPYIPGSALKGVARHAALTEIKSTPAEARPDILKRFVNVFGASDADYKNNGALARYVSNEQQHDQKGGVTFLPANPVDEARLEVDLTNVHTPDYYTGGRKARAGSAEGLKNEQPHPNPFPTVAAGAAFGFVIALNAIGRKSKDPSTLIADARRWLEQALTISGIGAKTGAGYGWFALDKELDEKLEKVALDAQNAAEQKAAAAEQSARKKQEDENRRSNLDPVALEMEDLLSLDDQSFAEVAKNLAEQPAPKQQAFFKLLLGEKKAKWKAWKKKAKKRPTEIVTSVQTSAETLNIQLP